jgi:hypothetical protein
MTPFVSNIQIHFETVQITSQKWTRKPKTGLALIRCMGICDFQNFDEVLLFATGH